jgi:hypothetical protein
VAIRIVGEQPLELVLHRGLQVVPPLVPAAHGKGEVCLAERAEAVVVQMVGCRSSAEGRLP